MSVSCFFLVTGAGTVSSAFVDWREALKLALHVPFLNFVRFMKILVDQHFGET